MATHPATFANPCDMAVAAHAPGTNFVTGIKLDTGIKLCLCGESSDA